MEEVTKDKGGAWFFDGNKTYVFINDNGNREGRIFANQLTNPSALWMAKCKRANVSMQSKEAMNLKPSEVVYKLWEHNDAKSNN